jgi:hypothetical protein
MSARLVAFPGRRPKPQPSSFMKKATVLDRLCRQADSPGVLDFVENLLDVAIARVDERLNARGGAR